jgi:outer membrane protein assembly factor BamD (BamD/ComL family)
MNRIKIFVFATFMVFLFSSCKSHKKEDLNLINKIENDINSSMNTKFDEKKVNDYIEACKKYSENYPGDTVCSTLLLKSGRLAMNLPVREKADEAIVYFDKVVKEYSHSKDAPVALFMKGFYIENNMKDIQKAGETYREFLRKYPNHMLAKDAKTSLDNLGKPLEQVIKEFEAKQKDTSLVKVTKK